MAKATKKPASKKLTIVPPTPEQVAIVQAGIPALAAATIETSTPYEKEAATEVINLRVPASVKSILAAEAIRDGRSISQVTLRAIKLGLIQMGL